MVQKAKGKKEEQKVHNTLTLKRLQQKKTVVSRMGYSRKNPNTVKLFFQSILWNTVSGGFYETWNTFMKDFYFSI